VILNTEQIKHFIAHPNNSELLDVAEKQQKKAELFINGRGLEYFFQKVDGVENEEYIKLKQRLCNAITVPLYEKTLTNVSRVFTGQGGSVSYVFKTENEDTKQEAKRLLQQTLSKNIAGGQNFTEFIESTWANKNIWINPFGILLVELNKETGEPYIASIPVESDGQRNIWDVGIASFDKLEYLILFKGVIEHEDVEYEVFRVIDDEKDVHILREVDTRKPKFYLVVDADLMLFEQLESEITDLNKFLNPFGQVPALFNSNRETTLTILQIIGFTKQR